MTAPRRCSATYPLGDGLVVRCELERGHGNIHQKKMSGCKVIKGKYVFGRVVISWWPRKKKELISSLRGKEGK